MAGGHGVDAAVDQLCDVVDAGGGFFRRCGCCGGTVCGGGTSFNCMELMVGGVWR